MLVTKYKRRVSSSPGKKIQLKKKKKTVAHHPNSKFEI